MDLVLGAAMNPLLDKLQPYPFARLRQLFADVTANPVFRPISLGIGEPKHATPSFIKDALSGSLDALAVYPATAGELPLREAFTGWVRRRYGLALDAATQVLPVNGSREALFALAQTVVDPTRRQPAPVRRKPGRAHRRPPEAAALRAVQGCAGSLEAAALSPSGGGGEASGGLTSAPVVVSPNPFYQIYEGAALLAGADTWYAASDPARNFAVDWDSVPAGIWARTQLVYVCSPGNPTGAVMPLEEWRKLFALSDRHGFVIASDECYSEIYFRDEPPLGALQAAAQLGRKDFRNLIALTSLSKRSNVPGLRSGFVAGDAAIIKSFLLYRTYHGSAMSGTVAAASIAAWGDESHVVDNRAQYRTKFAAVTPLLEPVLDVRLPDASFYLWAGVPPAWNGDDPAFARALYAQYNVTVLPGSYLAREVSDQNPGAGRIRMALVADTAECIEAAQRIVQFIHKPIA